MEEDKKQNEGSHDLIPPKGSSGISQFKRIEAITLIQVFSKSSGSAPIDSSGYSSLRELDEKNNFIIKQKK